MDESKRELKETIGSAPQEAGKPVRPQSTNYFARHWRGDLGLGVSFWINGVLLSVVVGYIWIASRIYVKYVLLPGFANRYVSFLVFGAYILSPLVIYIWQMTGIFRSSLGLQKEGGSVILADGAKVMAVLGLILVLFLLWPDLFFLLNGYY